MKIHASNQCENVAVTKSAHFSDLAVSLQSMET